MRLSWNFFPEKFTEKIAEKTFNSTFLSKNPMENQNFQIFSVVFFKNYFARVKSLKATHSPIFTHKCHFFRVKFFLKRLFEIENFAKTTIFDQIFRFFTKNSISKSRLGERKFKWPFFEVDNDIFSKSYLLTYLVFVSPHHPFTKMFDNKFDFSITIFTDSLRFSPIFFEFSLNSVSDYPKFQISKITKFRVTWF